ncbi:DNA polymerase sliding clamp 2 [Varanus komodoensis]|nr:DNA polymerase sliding clamp 2 [Varanus komodoensis]
MEGMSAPADDSNHMSSVWEAQARIQGLEEDLSSLQSQMQQLDEPEVQPEESEKALKEVAQRSLDGTGQVDEMSSSAPSGGSGRECSPEKAKVEVSPVAVEAGDTESHQGRPEAAPAVKPSCQSSEPSEAPAGHQRKLAMEEMVIRDHLGQEVGSMDAVGQKQSSIGKQEELEGHTDLGNGCSLAPLHRAVCQEENPRAAERQQDGELGSRDGPEGESPTFQEESSSSRALQGETSGLDSPKQNSDWELEMGSLAKEVAEVGVEQKELPEQGTKEQEPAQGLAAGDDPRAQEQESQAGKQGPQELPGSEVVLLGKGGDRQEFSQDRPKPSFPGESAPVRAVPVPNSLDDTIQPLLSSLTSSLPEQFPLEAQHPSPQDAKGSLLGQTPSSSQSLEGLPPEPVLPLVPNSCPSTLLDQGPSLQESQEPLPAQPPSSWQEPPSDPNPPSQQDYLSSLEQKPSSLQGEATSLQEAKCLLDQIPSPACDANGKLLDQIPATPQEQSASMPVENLSSLPDPLTALPGQHLPSLYETERSCPVSAALQGQELETKGSVSEVALSLTNQPSSLPDHITAIQEAEGLSLEEIPVALQDQMPTSSETQNLSLPETNNFLSGQGYPTDEAKQSVPGDTSASVPDQPPLVLQDQKPASLEDTSSPSLQEASGTLPGQIMVSPPNQTLPCLPGEKGPPHDQSQEILAEQLPTPLKGQEMPLPEKPILSTLLEETPTLTAQALSPGEAQSAALQDATALPDVLPSSSQDAVQPLLDKAATAGGQELKEDGAVSHASTAATKEAGDVLENLQAEQQPLLNEAKASVAPLDISAKDHEPNAGIVKSTSQEAPTYTITSANTASSCQLQPAVPRQGESPEQGQSRRKQKSCQCCSVM